MPIILTAVVSGTLGFMVAAFAFSADDQWFEYGPDEYQRGYEDGFREGRIRKELIDALDDDLK